MNRIETEKNLLIKVSAAFVPCGHQKTLAKCKQAHKQEQSGNILEMSVGLAT